LWETLKAGRPWTGYVKNRCKNGDFYWVLANAAPIVERGEVVGYISARRKATPEAIAAHEAAYRLFREKRQGNLVIRFGKAVKRGRPNLNNVGIGAKLWGGIAVVIAVAAIATGSSWFGMQEAQRRFTGFVAHEQKLLDNYSEMYAQGLQAGQALRNIVLDPANRKAYENVEQAKRDFQEHLGEARAVPDLDENVRRSLEQIGTLSTKHFGVQERIIGAVKAGDMIAAHKMLNDEDTPVWREYKKLLLDGRKSLEDKVTAGRADVQRMVVSTGRVSLLSGLFALIIAAFIAWLLTRAIRRPMQEMDETFANVLQGNYSNVIDIARNDEIGRAMQGLQVLQTRMGFEVAETKRQADEMTRIKIALDSVSTPVRIADPGGRVIYANLSLLETLRRIEPNLKAQNQAFSVDAFVGSSIGNLYADPDGALKRLAALSATVETTMDIGGRTYRVVTSPVFNPGGERLGSVGEWQDRTDQILVEKEISAIVASASAGSLDSRIDLAGKDGFFLTLAQGINGLLETTQTALVATSEVLSRVSQGDLTQKIEADYQGIFGQLKDDTNTTIERLREVVGRIKDATEAINIASQEIAAGNQDLSSRTEEQASSLEETSSAMEELNATVKQNAENAKQANELAKTSNAGVTKGSQVVKDVVVTMGDIQASSKKISDIIGVIDSIAFQTNILALNAAVEAARAGEQGRGFAVVATEVRNLAQRSATAAKEIKTLIAESVDKVESGARLVQQAGSTMDEVVTSFQQVASLVTEIASASREQSSGIEQTTQAVSQMDEVTQQNAALVEEAAAAAESLEEQARGLVQTVSMFKLAEGGGRSLPAPALRDATPKQLGSRPAARPGPAPKKIAPPHLADDGEQWEEF
jgi:methyl-accepting chemotaxis protein